MTEETGYQLDPLDILLQPPIRGDGHEALRRRLLDQTTRALRRRRRWRALAWTGALAACYAAGVLTMFWLAPRRVEVVQGPPPQSAPATVPETQPAVPAPADAVASSAVALEWKAFDADKPRPDLYRQAGDRYLHEEADPASAVRCYGQSLNGASDKDLAISADDDYLLMLVKEARQKERSDAKKRG